MTEPVNFALNQTEVRLKCIELLIDKLNPGSLCYERVVIEALLKNAAQLSDFVLDGKLPR